MINYQQEDQNQQAALEKAKRETLKSLDGYTYCMVSTLNQMVNYLPMLLFPQMTKQLYITIGEQDSERTQAEEGEASKANKNKPFDEALAAACSKAGVAFPPSSDYLVLGTPYDTSAVQADIENKINTVGKICWNITGGQRPILMAILEIAKCRAGDYILYLEGNEGNLVIQESDGQGDFNPIDLSADGNNQYRFKEDEPETKLTIPIALKLMGADVSKKASRKFVPHDALKTIAEKYEKPENELFRARLLSLNKKFTDKTEAMKGRSVKHEEVNEKKLYYLEEEHTINGKKQLVRFYNNKIWKAEAMLKSYLLKEGDDSYLSQTEYDFFTQSENYKTRTFPFGHLLEDLYAQKIWEAFGDKVAEMACNVRLYSPEEDVDGQTDEIDIALLTKTGQLVVFEVKSGSMSGDVAKSTHYTTYAIAGVYGKPVLLTALLKGQIGQVGALSKVWPYKTSAAAVRAANRAQLPIIALDGDDNNDFATAIENLLHL